MKRFSIAWLVLVLGSLACTKVAPTPSPTLLTPNPTIQPLPTSAFYELGLLGDRSSVVQAEALEVRSEPNELAQSFGTIPNGYDIDVIACRWVDGNLWVEHRWSPTTCDSDPNLCALGWSAGIWHGEHYLDPLGMCSGVDE